MKSKERRLNWHGELLNYDFWITVVYWPPNLYRLLELRVSFWLGFVFEIYVLGLGFSVNISSKPDEKAIKEAVRVLNSWDDPWRDEDV